MGFRFRRSFKLFAGVRLNLSKSGVSVSLGGNGATVNLGRTGAKATVGIPGTGLSWTSSRKSRSPLSTVKHTLDEPTPPLSNSSPFPQTISKGRNEPTVDVAEVYAGETVLARSLALKHDDEIWEYALGDELLRSKLSLFRDRYEHFDDLVRAAPKREIDGIQLMKLISDRGNELVDAVTGISLIVNKKLGEALGEPGVPGDAVALLDAVNSLFAHSWAFLQFEIELSATEVPARFEKLKAAPVGMVTSVIRLLDDLSFQWTTNTNALRRGSHEFDLKVRFHTPAQLDALEEEFNKIQDRPEDYFPTDQS
ncbi:DUF4236 domain-containing protein (plasmid) [Bradyrhizobium sp. 186]|uniref:DUF4236 domain-containing protein n=1 Tax=Bradyrhizobium sp. 186 TaxID=2782654 RepID=UPI0020016FDB|nr:DUF4236 domain-containing protein [Bradyrhizobium sp. 186]UPK40859.1 DUF4236 domain-containing protein [Bradyrhizobium sp. 186]